MRTRCEHELRQYEYRPSFAGGLLGWMLRDASKLRENVSDDAFLDLMDEFYTGACTEEEEEERAEQNKLDSQGRAP